MVKRAGAKPADAAGRKKARKQQQDEELGEAGDFFLLDEDTNKPKRAEEESEEEVEETAEERRLRLAKSYLDHLRAAGEDEEGAEGADDDALAERLKQDAAEAYGRLQRHIAQRISVPEPPSTSTDHQRELYGAGRFRRAHSQSATAVALTADDTTAFSVSKDGSIFRWNLETMQKTQLFRPGEKRSNDDGTEAADWVKRNVRQSGRSSLLAAAVSSDGQFLAVGGGDKKVHVFDARSGVHVQSYPGHRDIVTGLAFREGTHTLLSASFDRTIKLWSLDDGAYMDSLFGHQAEVLALDVLRAERVVSSGHDRSCRVWKIPEESQLIFRSRGMAQDCCRYITGTEWISGASDGSLQVWSQMKKKPVFTLQHAHGSGGHSNDSGEHAPASDVPSKTWANHNSDATGWIQSVAACRGSDVVASGAGDGFIRLWEVAESKFGGAGALEPLHALPARGYVNGLAIAKSGRFVVAALGQEPRLGRWGKVDGARNGLLLHPLNVAAESAGDEDQH